MYIDLGTIDWNSVSAIIAFLAFVAILLTLREMKNHRSYIYKPLLYIGKKRFIAQKNNTGVPVIWKESYEHVDDRYTNEFFLELANIGSAAAHSIRVEWIVDIDRMKQNMNKYISSGSELTKTEHGNRTNYFFGTRPYGFFIENDDFVEEISFIPKEDNVDLKLPDGIKNYLSFYPNFFYKNQKEKQIKFDIDIPINVKLEYLDLAKKKITQNIVVSIDI